MAEQQDQAVKPTALQDLEDRRALELGETPLSDLPARDFTGGRDEKDLAGFVGVDPMYRNYSDDRDKPLFSEGDGAEGYFEQKHVDASDAIIVGRPDPEDDDDKDDDKDDEKDKTPAGKAPAASPAKKTPASGPKTS